MSVTKTSGNGYGLYNGVKTLLSEIPEGAEYMPLEGMTVIEWDGETADLVTITAYDTPYYRVADCVPIPRRCFSVNRNPGSTQEYSVGSWFRYLDNGWEASRSAAYNPYAIAQDSGIYFARTSSGSFYTTLLAYEPMTEYESHYSVASAELVATADAIRAKSGNASGIVWEKDTGFAGAVESISPVLQEKTVTENGEVVPDEGFDGLSKVTVAVESSGGAMAINGIIEQYKVNAGATVNAGDFVEFVNKFKTGMFSSGTVGDVSACKLDNSRVLIAYRDSGNSNFGTAVVLSLGADGVTVGEAVVFNSVRTSYPSVVALTDSKVLVAYLQYDGSYSFTAVILTVDGTNVAVGTEKVTSTASYANTSAVALTDSKVLVLYKDGINYYAIVLTISGTTIAAGTATNLGSAPEYPSVVALTDSKVLVAYRHAKLTAVVLTINGTTITAGTATTCSSNSASGYISAVALTDSKVLVAYQDVGNSGYGTAIVLTVSETTITARYEKVFDYNTVTYNFLVAFSETSALVAYNNTTGAFTSLAIDGTTITADGAETGTFVQKATSRLHNVGVAATGGSEGEMVDVYVVG